MYYQPPRLILFLSSTEKDCGPAVNITGGNVTYTDTLYLSYATYTCREGYDLYNNGYLQRSGRSTVRCLSTGLWTLPPVCRREYQAESRVTIIVTGHFLVELSAWTRENP